MVLVFDIDGTLVDQRGAELEAAAEFLRDCNGVAGGLSPPSFCQRWRAARERHFPALLTGGLFTDEYHRRRIRSVLPAGLDISDAEADALYSRFEHCYRRAWRAYADAGAALAELCCHTLVVLSNGRFDFQREKLRATGLLPFFKHVFVSEQIGAAKPSELAFQVVQSACGCMASEIACVGDDLHCDVQAARALGWRGFWLNRQTGGGAVQPGTIRSLLDLPPLLPPPPSHPHRRQSVQRSSCPSA